MSSSSVLESKKRSPNDKEEDQKPSAPKKAKDNDSNNSNESNNNDQEWAEMAQTVALMLPMRTLERLTEQWNLEGTEFMGDEYSEYTGGREQLQYLQDLEQIVKTGTCSYQNPMGEDDRESFGSSFEADLTTQEQTFFWELARASYKDEQPIDVQKIHTFLHHGPFLPIRVDLGKNGKGKKGNDNNKNSKKKKSKKSAFENGSERFPFSSLQAAQDCYQAWKTDPTTMEQVAKHDGPMVELKCGSDCQHQTCSVTGCQATLCDRHGNGQGRLLGTKSISFHHCGKCLGCHKVVCPKHERQYFQDCDICANREPSSCAASSPPTVLPPQESSGTIINNAPCRAVCRDCGKMCGKKTSDGNVCKVFCCPKCLQDHKCCGTE